MTNRTLRIYLFALTIILTSCTKLGSQSGAYEALNNELAQTPGGLAECQCLPGFVRRLGHLNESLRGEVDRQATNLFAKDPKVRPTLFFYGSGRLLNESTILASLMAKGISPKVILFDKDYSYRAGIPPTEGGKPDELEQALKTFQIILPRIAKKYKTEIEIEIFYDFNQAIQKSITDTTRLVGFFMLDVFFPTEYSISKLKEDIRVAFGKGKKPSSSIESYLFFLNKKEKGQIKFPSPKGTTTPPSIGFDPSVLDIYSAELTQNGLTGEKLILELEDPGQPTK